MKLVLLLAAMAVALASATPAEKRKDVWARKDLSRLRRLHKEESNLVDLDGPTKPRGRNSNGLLGLRGEHWALKSKKWRRNKKHRHMDRQRNDRDDARLQVKIVFERTTCPPPKNKYKIFI